MKTMTETQSVNFIVALSAICEELAAQKHILSIEAEVVSYSNKQLSRKTN